MLKTLFVRLRVCNKSPFEDLTIRSSIRMLQTDFRLCRSGIHAELVYKHEWSTGPNGLQAQMVYKRDWSTSVIGLQVRMVYM